MDQFPYQIKEVVNRAVIYHELLKYEKEGKVCETMLSNAKKEFYDRMNYFLSNGISQEVKYALFQLEKYKNEDWVRSFPKFMSTFNDLTKKFNTPKLRN